MTKEELIQKNKNSYMFDFFKRPLDKNLKVYFIKGRGKSMIFDLEYVNNLKYNHKHFGDVDDLCVNKNI